MFHESLIIGCLAQIGKTNEWVVPLMKIHTMHCYYSCNSFVFPFQSNVFSKRYNIKYRFYNQSSMEIALPYGFNADFIYAMKAYGAFRFASFMVLCTFSIKS